MAEHEPTSAEAAAEAPPAPAEPKLLPARLSPFAPADPQAEARTRARLEVMTFSQLRNRRNRIDKRLFELGLSVGEPSLAIPSVRGTGLIDIDRIVRKVDKLEEAREQARLERELDRPQNTLGALAQDQLGWLADAFLGREIRARRGLLVSELGLALCAADQRVIAEYAPHLKRLLDDHVATARRVDELFIEMTLVDEEFERRAAAGQADDPPKEIDALLAKALDSVDDVSSRVGGRLAELGKSAAKNAAKAAVSGGSQAVIGIASGAAKGAWALGSKAVTKLADREDSEEAGPAEPELLPASEAPTRRLPPAARSLPLPMPIPAPAPGPRPGDIPGLIRDLARLRDEGILEEEEFREKKADLLDRL